MMRISTGSNPILSFSYDIGLKPTVNINLKPLNDLTKYLVSPSAEEVKEDVDQVQKAVSRKMEYGDKYDKSKRRIVRLGKIYRA